MTAIRWIELDGAVNVRDLGSLPATDGQVVRPRALLRSDSVQELSNPDVRRLVDEVGVRTIVDLRTSFEVNGEGHGPLREEPLVTVHHLSLFDEPEITAGDDEPAVLPWQGRTPTGDREADRSAGSVYFKYLDERPDSILQALRLIARTDGATLVHCAAGKDRTGVVVAMALTEVGVDRDAVVADYALTAERIELIITRLAAKPTYAGRAAITIDDDLIEQQRPRPETMRGFLERADEIHGGVSEWLRSQGWTDADASALRRRLLTRY
ncbi:protein tyrosine/serine phosphatase [Jatrophihabitans sp. GAS493]|uniref:tyrosine-protein phosphatase n=1 Tax=Jatrophihabitans sp. GAS493 TaxID=1907575 RepID=UPI000BB7CC84|nr:tyrosine-protein phosphatase [Jatrophihabitans sp. GAS493]SOD72155.1 protein tyrosine/serine phosphatase [Jatrophihabitans sp. GAS493]